MNSISIDRRTVRAREQRTVMKNRILRAAEDVIASKGYKFTSIADVIEKADVSRGTFYLYFDSRDALFHELIDGFIEKLRGSIKRIQQEEGNPVGQLLDNVRRVLDLLFDHRNLAVILWREAIGLDDQIDEKLNGLNTFLYSMVAGALRNGAEWKLIRKVDESVIAMAIIGSMKEVLYQYLVVQKEDMPDRESVSRELLEFGLRGLQPDTEI